MTPEEYADTIIARLTMEPQGRWDADVVEFETKSADISEVKAWIAEGIRRAVAEEREAAVRLLGQDIAYAMEHTNDPHCTERDVWARYAQRLTDLAAAIRARG